MFSRRRSSSEGTKRQHVLFVVENQTLPYDRRVWAEARWAKERGFDVTGICPCDEISKCRYESVEGIEILRYPRFNLPLGKWGFVLEYVHAFFWQILLSLKVYFRKPFQIIHAANPPDNIFLIGILFRLLGSRFIYDIHDLSPELYMTKYPGKKGLLYNILMFLEKLSCWYAHVIVTPNESYRDIIRKRHGTSFRKIFVVRNDPELAEFRGIHAQFPRKRTGKIRLVYVGAINAQDGVDVLVDVLARLAFELKEENFFCTVIGNGEYLGVAREHAEKMNMLNFIEFLGAIRDRKTVLEYVFGADICLEPAADNELNSHSTFIKVMEYMAAGKPVVAFDLPETKVSADGSGILVPPGDVRGFAEAIRTLMHDGELRERLGKAGAERITKCLNWDNATRGLEMAYSLALRSGR